MLGLPQGHTPGEGSSPPHPPTPVWIQLQAAWSWPELTGTGALGGGGGAAAAPPPTYQCPPLSGRSWLPLPLGERLSSFPATDGAAGSGCRTEGACLVIKVGWEPAWSPPPSGPLCPHPPAPRRGRPTQQGCPVPYFAWVGPRHWSQGIPRAPCYHSKPPLSTLCRDTGCPQMDQMCTPNPPAMGQCPREQPPCSPDTRS